MTDAEILAYLAGAIDSDGSIGIRRSTYSMRVRGDSSAPVFSERVMLKQVQPDIPMLLKERFRGSLYVTKPSVARGKPLHTWEVTNMRAVECLNALLPYLRVKRRQAENCIALRAMIEQSKTEKVAFDRGHAGAAHRSASLTLAMEYYYSKAKELNSVGV